MRKVVVGLVICSLAHRAMAELPLVPERSVEKAERRRATGKALVGSGLALIGVALVSALSLTLTDLDHKNGGTFSGLVAGPVIGAVGIAFTASGASLWGASEPATTPWQRARRLRAGRGLVGAGVAAQLLAVALGPVAFTRATADSPSANDASTKTLIGTTVGLGAAGLVMMCAGIPLLVGAHQDTNVAVSFGATSLRLTF